MLSNEERFSLINVANIRSGLLKDNFVTSPKVFAEYADQSRGVPILIQANKNLFHFEKKDVFELSSKQILKTIYLLSDDAYVGFKHAFSHFKFLTNFEFKRFSNFK